MNKFLAMVLCLVMPITVFASDNGYKVTYAVLAGLEGVTGKKAVNSDAMTVKN